MTDWLRPDAPCSAGRLFCHAYGRNGRSSEQSVPGRPYSCVAALVTGRTSWCRLLDALRPDPDDDVAEVSTWPIPWVADRPSTAESCASPGTLTRLQVDHLPRGQDPLPVWLWPSKTGMTSADVDLRW
ncbi:hypothetical protein GCM10018785_60390 [Streptomyces longispororuber]|uniref:Transposase IS701-like DDE domain-containing protein n=1 Tax=Streptomyces longispororuber TaxID=68230 RepID=A0A919A2B7_9ACTN|nr:hypothetical protein GCM10018785_60390 [Streptomyces longispororuber]